MYRVKNNKILTGNDRIKKLREKHLYNDFKQKYINNKNSTNSKIRKIPYIKNNSQKIMIANGYINNDCSNSICVKTTTNNDISCNFIKNKLDTDNNFYSIKNYNTVELFRGTGNNDISFNSLTVRDNSFNLINNYKHIAKNKLNHFNNNLNYGINKERNYEKIKISNIKL